MEFDECASFISFVQVRLLEGPRERGEGGLTGIVEHTKECCVGTPGLAGDKLQNAMLMHCRYTTIRMVGQASMWVAADYQQPLVLHDGGEGATEVAGHGAPVMTSTRSLPPAGLPEGPSEGGVCWVPGCTGWRVALRHR